MSPHGIAIDSSTSPSGAGTEIVQQNLGNTMAADAPAPAITRPSAAIALYMQDKQILVFYGERFQLPMLSQCWEMIENANIFSCFINTNSAWQGDTRKHANNHPIRLKCHPISNCWLINLLCYKPTNVDQTTDLLFSICVMLSLGSSHHADML